MPSLYTETYTIPVPQTVTPDELQAWHKLIAVLRQLNVDFLDHSARHENGGADEISVEGLSGLLADKQTALQHGLSDIEFHSAPTGATEDHVVTFDSNGLPQDSGYSMTTISRSSSQWGYVLGLIGVGGI